MKRLLLIAGIAQLLSCQNDDIEFVSTLDASLEALLVEASPTKEMDYFMMPESDDFSSIPQDPKNPINAEKVKLGQLLYHETGLALAPKNAVGKETYSCATCHFASAGFQAGRQQGISDGGIGFGANGESRRRWALYAVEDIDVQPIRTPTAMNGAFQELTLWNGQFGAVGDNVGTEAKWTPGTPKENNILGYHGLETQAIAGITVHRMIVNNSSLDSMAYKPLFDEAFPDIPANVRYTREYAGLAIAAYERTVLSNQAPFQRWMRGDKKALSTKEKKGALLFFGKANCVSCHTGPALNQMDFYALGMKDLVDCDLQTFNTKIENVENLGRGGFTGLERDMFKFKVPQLYNLADSPFYGHGSSFTSVREVIEYKNNAVAENPRVPEHRLSPGFVPLGLTDEEIDQLTEFIENGLRDFNLDRYVPNSVNSGHCFPNNDPMSKMDLGCS